MRFKILITGGHVQSTAIEAEMLKDKGFMVYTCEPQNTGAMVQEVHPDVIYVRQYEAGTDRPEPYKMTNKEINRDIPLIITLLEDDTYLLKKKNPATNKQRNFVCDNLFDAIKISLTGIEKNNLQVNANHTSAPTFVRR